MKKIAINGFGRIGRAVFKAALESKKLKVAAINDLSDAKTLAQLLKYDSVYGRYAGKVSADSGNLRVNGRKFPVFNLKNPAKLPWKKFKIDLVLECTGQFTDQKKARAHLAAGAKRVIISAPAKDEATQTIVPGTDYTADCLKKKKIAKVFSMASCTTNCASPVIQVLESNFGVAKALLTTIHSYTASQNLVDGAHKDPRRGRAAAENMVLTTTGAAIATTKALPAVSGLFDGLAVRVPTSCGSLSDITVLLKVSEASVEGINKVFKKAAKSRRFREVLAVSEEPLVSSDFIGNPFSAIVDLNFTKVVGGNLVKIIAWYDNEWGYSKRLAGLAEKI